MTARNSSDQWGAVSRAFHWGMLVMIAVQVPLGLWMVEVYEVFAETFGDDTWVMRTSNWHHTLGFLMLAAVCARFSWRALNPVPGLPARMPGWQRRLARLTHGMFYVLLFIYPLTGWASLSAYEAEFPIFFFGWADVPRLVPQAAADDFFNYEFFAVIHRACWRIGAVLLLTHAGAALWHHYRSGDGILLRMLKGKPADLGS